VRPIGQCSGYTWKAKCYPLPYSKDTRDFARLTARHLIADLNEEALTSNTGIDKSINKLGKEKKGKRLSVVKPPLTSQILQDGMNEGLPPDAQFVRFEAR